MQDEEKTARQRNAAAMVLAAAAFERVVGSFVPYHLHKQAREAFAAQLAVITGDRPGDLVETMAEAIYKEFDWDRGAEGPKPMWVPRGNSLKQDEARRYARAAAGVLS